MSKKCNISGSTPPPYIQPKSKSVSKMTQNGLKRFLKIVLKAIQTVKIGNLFWGRMFSTHQVSVRGDL